jgi:pyridoxine 5-phosphate synthase
VYELAALMQDWPGREFNIEGNPLHNLMDLVRELKERGLPLHQCTLVPDSETQLTSDHGWRLPQDGERLAPLIAQIQTQGVRVSLFMDPLPEAMALAQAVGADRVELYTERYAQAASLADSAEKKQVLQLFRQTAQAAQAVGLGVNAGHDLNLHNLGDFLQAVPGVLEVSIGHALMADALEQGYSATVKNYLHSIAQGQP